MRARATFLVGILLTGSLLSPAFADSPEWTDTVCDGYLVQMKHAVPESAVHLSGCEEIGDALYYADTVQEVRSLSRFDAIEYWEPNYLMTLQEQAEMYEPQLWNLRSIEAASIWSHRDEDGIPNRLGSGVTIAVVDSGVMASHPDLQHADILDPVILSSDEDGVDSFHGTFIAGELAAEVNNGIGIDGLVPEVTILPVCITSEGGKTDIKTTVQGIRAAAEMGADVISLSVGSRNDSRALHDICDYADSLGVILVASAGNYKWGEEKSSSNYMYPAAYESVISVSACRQEEAGVVFDNAYSYYNDAVTVSAPGTAILSLSLDGDVVCSSGTSFSAPMVAALAVIAKQTRRGLDRSHFEKFLEDSSDDLGDAGYDVCYGMGYINGSAFLRVLDEYLTENPYMDVPKDRWSYPDIVYVTDHHIMNGMGDGWFEPEWITTRAMLVTMLWRLEGSEKCSDALFFLDVEPGVWYEDAVRWATHNGIAVGYDPAWFGAEDRITREQTAVMMYRFAQYKEYGDAGNSVETENDIWNYEDATWISEWAMDGMVWAVRTGLICGMDDTHLAPADGATREQMATIMARFCRWAAKLQSHGTAPE